MKKIALFCLLLPATLFAQTNVATSEILATAKGVVSAQLHGQRQAFHDQLNQKLPFVEKLEFRTETNDFRLEEQRYLLRFEPNFPREMRVQANLNQARRELAAVEGRLLVEEALEDRYIELLSYFELSRERALKEKQMAVYQDQLYVIGIQLENLNADINDLIKVENDKNKLELSLLEIQQQMSLIQQIWQRDLADYTSITPELQNWISIESIQNLIAGSSADEVSPLFVEENKLKQYEADLAYQYEKTKANTLFDFAQVEVGGRNFETIEEGVSLGVSFRLPFKGEDRLDLNELRMEQLESVHETQIEQLELSNSIDQTQSRFQFQLTQLSLLNAQLASSKAVIALEQYKQMEAAPPMVLLNLQNAVLDKELEIIRSEHKVYRLYLEWLMLSGKLAALPLKNYFSETLEAY